MRFIDMVEYSMRSLHVRSLRSWLTIIGVIIGITSIVVLIGLVQGLKMDVENRLQAFGPRSIAILPVDISQVASFGGTAYAPTAGKLFDKDYERIKRLGSIDIITKVIFGRVNAEFKDQAKTASIIGVQPDAYRESVQSIEIESGRFLSESDSKVVVVGKDFAENTYEKKVQVDSTIYLSGEKFRVIGILKKTGNSFTQLDNAVLLPFDDARTLMGDSIAESEISAIRIVVKEGEDTQQVGDQINDIMLSSHHTVEDRKDFSVITPEFINQQITATTDLLSLFLGSIAAISLLVGGIGISNTMFMSVLERNREIGVLKAIGMQENDIIKLFLVEAGTIGISGGLIGLLLGAVLLYFLSFLGFPGVILPELAVGAIGFSAVIGILSGSIPARQAALLEPVETLRYE